jgi:hypothetical protein
MGRTVSGINAVVQKDRHKMVANLEARRVQMQTSMKLLETNPTNENAKKAGQMKTFVAKQLAARLQGHKPHFTRLVTVIQVRLIASFFSFSF